MAEARSDFFEFIGAIEISLSICLSMDMLWWFATTLPHWTGTHPPYWLPQYNIYSVCRVCVSVKGSGVAHRWVPGAVLLAVMRLVLSRHHTVITWWRRHCHPGLMSPPPLTTTPRHSRLCSQPPLTARLSETLAHHSLGQCSVVSVKLSILKCRKKKSLQQHFTNVGKNVIKTMSVKAPRIKSSL